MLNLHIPKGKNSSSILNLGRRKTPLSMCLFTGSKTGEASNTIIILPSSIVLVVWPFFSNFFMKTNKYINKTTYIWYFGTLYTPQRSSWELTKTTRMSSGERREDEQQARPGGSQGASPSSWGPDWGRHGAAEAWTKRGTGSRVLGAEDRPTRYWVDGSRIRWDRELLG